jgi:hypothetical protein
MVSMYYLFCVQGGDHRGRGQIRHLIVTMVTMVSMYYLFRGQGGDHRG